MYFSYQDEGICFPNEIGFAHTTIQMNLKVRGATATEERWKIKHTQNRIVNCILLLN